MGGWSRCDDERLSVPPAEERFLATGHWDQIVDSEASTGDQRMNLSELEITLSSGR